MTIDLKKFMGRGALFLMMLVLVLLGFNFLYIQKIEHKTIYWRNYFEFDEYAKTHKHLDYAFFGTSHTRDAMNPKYIPSSVNFSLSSQNYIVIYYRLKYLLENYNLKIETIVFEIDPISLLPRMADTKQLANYDISKLVPLDDIVKLSGLSRIDIWLRSNFPFFGRGFATYGALRTTPMELNLGWAKELGDFSKNPMDLDLEMSKAKNESTQPDSLSLEYFEKTLALAKERGINIIFLRNPHAREVDELNIKYGADVALYYKKIFAEIDKLNIKHNIVDNNDIFYDRPDLMHIDGGHVNYRGSEIVSKKFLEDVGVLQIVK